MKEIGEIKQDNKTTLSLVNKNGYFGPKKRHGLTLDCPKRMVLIANQIFQIKSAFL